MSHPSRWRCATPRNRSSSATLVTTCISQAVERESCPARVVENLALALPDRVDCGRQFRNRIWRHDGDAVHIAMQKIAALDTLPVQRHRYSNIDDPKISVRDNGVRREVVEA